MANALGLDARALMALFRLDRKLNLSAAYLEPGLGLGGSCLPKDLLALCELGRSLDLALPIRDAVLASNRRRLEQVLERIARHPVKRLGLLGLTFKAGTDDVRESSMVELIERLIGRGYEVRIYDPLVDPAALLGANLAFALDRLPHIARLVMPALEPVIDHAELLLIGHLDEAAAATILARRDAAAARLCAHRLRPRRAAGLRGDLLVARRRGGSQ